VVLQGAGVVVVMVRVAGMVVVQVARAVAAVVQGAGVLVVGVGVQVAQVPVVVIVSEMLGALVRVVGVQVQQRTGGMLWMMSFVASSQRHVLPSRTEQGVGRLPTAVPRLEVPPIHKE
jgi:hypothetical protein